MFCERYNDRNVVQQGVEGHRDGVPDLLMFTFEVSLATASPYCDREVAIGVVWLRVNGSEFPERGWVDNVVVLLGWWVESVQRMLADAAACESLDFMEGDYAVRLRRLGDSIRMEFVEGGVERFEGVSVGPMELAVKLLEVAEGVLVDGEPWWRASQDYLVLEEATRRLGEAVARRRDL